MQEGIKPTEKENHLEGEVSTALDPGPHALPTAEFVKVEKNLASLGFFTPSSKRSRNEKAKTVSVTVVIDGKRIEAKATIAPTALFGLPITADQDKWLALHKILSDLQARDGQVTNPVSFSSAELLALLKIYKDSGKNYKDVSDWLDVMVGTTIISEGAVYFAGKRTFGKDTFHVFDRAVSFGKELPDGSIADKNYIWLSQWQLQNINDHHQLPIDLDTYRQLKNYIAKALVPLLQVWLYATRQDGVFEKRYDELCQILNIRQWTYPSKIKEKLGPSLEELKQFGYLADWRIETTSDKRAYKILFFHGEKFHRDRRSRLSRNQMASGEGMTERHVPRVIAASSNKASGPSATQSQFPSESKPAATFDPQLIAEFTRRGITEAKARDLLMNLKPGQHVVAQLESAEQTVKQLQNTPNPVRNPAGFYIHLIERNTPVPDGFETSAKRKAREERERKEQQEHAAQEAEQQLQWDYDDYREQEIDRHIEANPVAFDAIKDAKWRESREKYSFTTESMAKLEARFEIRKQIPLLTFEEFVGRKKQGTDFSLKPVAVSPPFDQQTLDLEREVHTPDPVGEPAAKTETEAENRPAAVAGDATSNSAPHTEASLAEAAKHTASEPVPNTQQSEAAQEPTEQAPPPPSEPLLLFPSEPPPETGTGPIGPSLV